MTPPQIYPPPDFRIIITPPPEEIFLGRPQNAYSEATPLQKKVSEKGEACLKQIACDSEFNRYHLEIKDLAWFLFSKLIFTVNDLEMRYLKKEEELIQINIAMLTIEDYKELSGCCSFTSCSKIHQRTIKDHLLEYQDLQIQKKDKTNEINHFVRKKEKTSELLYFVSLFILCNQNFKTQILKRKHVNTCFLEKVKEERLSTFKKYQFHVNEFMEENPHLVEKLAFLDRVEKELRDEQKIIMNLILKSDHLIAAEAREKLPLIDRLFFPDRRAQLKEYENIREEIRKDIERKAQKISNET